MACAPCRWKGLAFTFSFMSDFKCDMFKNVHGNWAWLCLPSVLAYRRQRWADLCEFKGSLVYRSSSSTAKAVTQRIPVSKNQKQGCGRVLMRMALSSQGQGMCEHQNPPVPYSFYQVFLKEIWEFLYIHKTHMLCGFPHPWSQRKQSGPKVVTLWEGTLRCQAICPINESGPVWKWEVRQGLTGSCCFPWSRGPVFWQPVPFGMVLFRRFFL